MKTKVVRSFRGCSAAAAMLLLAGCSATHVGESWQCPLAQGVSCTSIAEADPAVPVSAAGQAVLFGEPLPGAGRTFGRAETGTKCGGSCGLLAWFRELLGPGRPPSPATATTAATSELAPGSDGEVISTEHGAATDGASLRVPEVVGRIWIAPFVDADGTYREAHWVRVVLEPAGWRLP